MVQLGVGQVFAEYTIEGVLGRGGMGSVYLARHPRLPRQVALKLLAPEVSGDVELRRRFEQEANAIARLDHPNIVGIHDRGVYDGRLWIAMQYIEGTDASRLNPLSLSVARAVRIINETAAALDYAHSRGVLHRDVKPANILLAAPAAAREERAILTDFGIARVLDANTQLTSTGAFAATLGFASPEQLSGRRVDHLSDQYSLGCTLFALLSGESPFAATNPGQVVAGHLAQATPALSSERIDVPPALDAVLARATAKAAADRFMSCTEFAAAAAAAVDQPSMLSRRTAPTVISSGPNPAGNMVVGSGWPTPQISTAQVVQGLVPVNESSERVAGQHGISRRKLLIAGSAAVSTAVGIGLALSLTQGNDSVRSSAAPTASSGNGNKTLNAGDEVKKLAFSQDGALLAATIGVGGIQVWDRPTLAPMSRMSGHDDVTGLVFGPEGKSLVTCCWNPTVQYWDPRTGQPLGDAFRAGTQALTAVAVSPDNASLVTAGDGGIGFWDLQSRQPLGDAIDMGDDRVWGIAFTPDSSTVAISGQLRVPGVLLYDMHSHAQTGELAGPDKMYYFSVAISPDGRTLAAGDGHGVIRVWDTSTQQLLGELNCEAKVDISTLAFSLDGRTLAAGSGGLVTRGDTRIWLWDVVSRNKIRDPLTGHGDKVRAVVFAPDGSTLVSGSADSTIRFWDLNHMK
ncbi:WD40 repeat domain-containing serine/threonine protein kinase [Nocardia sp. NPDC020380]|uniref:WD40 repeat domain-containing serine/threonine protein kinase n=1 Tax=Nocardia sp. NPDC020380 TaxID=3364309 RepID=UPI0037931CB3